jgi:hypothetical protein
MIEPKEIRLFFSWQSDRVESKKIIQAELQKATKRLVADGIVLYVDQDTRDRIGIEKIETSVLQKICDCDIFIADLTPVTEVNVGKDDNFKRNKLMPNSNVMYEYGFAVGVKGMNRMIAVANLKEGELIEQLPFDINHDTIISFNVEKGKQISLYSLIKRLSDEVIAERNQKKKQYESQVFFTLNNEQFERIIIHPQYKRIQYVRESNLNLATQPQPSTLMSTMELLSTYVNHINRTGNLVPPSKIVNIKPYSQIIDHSACPMRFTVANIGEYELDNLFLFINIETPNVTFTNDNIENKGIGINLKKTDYVIIKENRMQCEMGLINPDMMITTNLIYLTVPHGIEQVNLSWHVQSTRHQQDGIMIVDVKPGFEYEVVEDNAKAGTEEIVPYKEYK